VKDGAQKAVARAWFYLDFKIFIDVVKWRMYKVRKTIDDKLRDVRHFNMIAKNLELKVCCLGN